MVSISSAKLIQERTINFCRNISDWDRLENSQIYKKLNEHLQKEYEIIPVKERVGKGTVYIAKYVAKAVFRHLDTNSKQKTRYYITFSEKSFEQGKKLKSLLLKHFSLLVFSEIISSYPKCFKEYIPLIKKWALDEDWTVRETIGHSIRAALKKIPKKTIEFLKDLSKSREENLRRVASESLRPLADIKWLRDPTKNHDVIDILTSLRADPSIYVRKSVGNNIKDLTKYMPEKMIKLMEMWIKISNIEVHDKLATEVDLQTEEKRLIWTMKHAMRWLKNRNPEYHDGLKEILGKHYVLYFNEKSNRLAKPRD